MLELYRTASLETLSHDFVAAVTAVIKADCYSINWLVSRRDQMLSLRFHEPSATDGSRPFRVRNWYRYPEYPPEADINVFNQFVSQHPLFHHWEGHAVAPARWSEFVTLRELREKAIHREYFRYAEVNYQLGTASVGGTSGDVAVACNRRSCDFTAAEKQLLGMMTPHFEQAMKLAVGRAALGQVRSCEGIAANIGAAMIVTDAGAVLFCNPKAQALCEKFFGRFNGIPAKVAEWLTGNYLRALSIPKEETILIVECEVAQPAEVVLADLSGNGLTGKTIYLLRLAERSNTPLEVALQTLGLTPREAEVLSWMAKGKRNAEIAIILGMRVATVGKHAENIFRKLEVENRTTAIARAWETVGT